MELDETVAKAAETLDAATGDTLAPDATVHPLMYGGEDAGPRTLDLTRLSRLHVEPADAGAPAPRDCDFVLLGDLGSGGMGVVQLARQEALQREVAIKRIRRDGSDRHVQALLEEAMFMGFLEHPNIIPVHALGLDEDRRPLLVMKRVDGESWREVLKRERRSDGTDWLPRQLEIFLQVCNAVAFAHSRGVIHRDIKPENVMLGEFGEVYLLDWGVSLRLSERERTGTHLVGTPAYMAPEMVQGDPGRLSERTDVFLLGATLHEVLTGAPRHAGDSIGAVLKSVAQTESYPYPNEVPAELAAICHRACAAEPRDRYPDVRALQQAIEDYIAHRASSELAREAQQRLDELVVLLDSETPGHTLEGHQLFNEARFGFEQALRAWPDNPTAADGLRRALFRMAGYEAQAGNLEHARILVSELENRGATDGLDELRSTLRAQEAEAARTRVLARELDARIGRTSRQWIFGALASFITVAVIVLAVTSSMGVVELSYTKMIVAPTVILMVVSLVIWLARGSMLATRFNRAFSYGILILVGGVIVSRMVGAMLDQPVRVLVLFDVVHVATIGFILAAALHRFFALPSSILLSGALLTAGFDLEVVYIAPFVFVAVAILLVGWRRIQLQKRDPSA